MPTRIRQNVSRVSDLRIQHFRLNADPDPDPTRIRIQPGSRGFMTKTWKKFTAEKLTYPLASIKDLQVTKEAFSSQKRISITSKNEIS
jgi:hypothetical protein